MLKKAVTGFAAAFGGGAASPEELGEELLQEAAKIAPDHEKIEILIKAGARMDSRNGSGWTPLIQAARQGNRKTVEQLLAAGAVVDQGDMFGFTPLMWAASEGHAVVVQKLLSAGASTEKETVNGQTALMMARESGRIAAADILQEAHLHARRAAAEEKSRKEKETMAWLRAGMPVQRPRGVKPLKLKGRKP